MTAVFIDVLIVSRFVPFPLHCSFGVVASRASKVNAR